ncbi:glycosyltransferase [Chthonobacter albigriseus]|uniref:glycosyltransferase n=1 Tax=Chthonobacter albigriseus TaxID=1683161 RepID=UPI001FCED6B3|nr:glycosyltransferase [Chthonobacter albigriseus]
MNAVCAVVLTYNRKALLHRCLEAVASQTRPCDRIIVVDNASTDGTLDELNEVWGDRIEVLALSRNVGAAGGFSIGMRVGYQTGAERLWLMDDDVIPDPDALERLLAGEARLAERGLSASYLVSVARTGRGLMINTPGIDLRQNEIWSHEWPKLLDIGLVPVNRATFVSILLPRVTMARHGALLAEMFIWGEDVEYTTRVALDVPGYVVGESKVQHLRQIEGELTLETESNPARIRYHFHRTRNMVFIRRRYDSRTNFIREVLLNLKRAAYFLRRGEWLKVKILVAGVARGITFSPEKVDIDRPFRDEPIDFPAYRTRYGV